MLDNIIYGALGLLLGGVLGGSIAGYILAKDYGKRIDELDRRVKLLIDENEELRGAKIQEMEKRIEAEEKVLGEELRKDYDTTTIKDDLDDDLDEDDDVFDSSYDIPEIDDEPIRKGIKVVTEQFYNNESNYTDSEQLTYYQLDDLLIDSMDSIVFDEEDLIGPEAMDILQDTKNDYIYLLDQDAERLYEITVEHNLNYTRDLMGY